MPPAAVGPPVWALGTSRGQAAGSRSGKLSSDRGAARSGHRARQPIWITDEPDSVVARLDRDRVAPRQLPVPLARRPQHGRRQRLRGPEPVVPLQGAFQETVGDHQDVEVAPQVEVAAGH